MEHKNNIEKRFITQPLEIEKRADGEESRFITGYGVVFDSWSRDLGWFKETVDKKAFDDVDMGEVVATFNHNFDNVLARSDSDTLELTIDSVGVKYRFEAPNTTYGNDLLENVRNGNVKGSSFMFTTLEQRWTYKDDESEIDEREIVKVDRLIELGPVTMPAYPDTTAAQRSHDIEKPQIKVDNRSKTIDIDVKLAQLKTKFAK